jgi:nicotinamide riboside kinase
MGIKNTLIVNLYGGPGSGKSTMMASLFAKLKWNKIDCEMATEYAKDKVWENSIHILDDQLYVTAKQYHRLFRLNGKVDVILTDSPILLGTIYNETIKIQEFDILVYKLNEQFNNLNIFLERKKVFNPNGRLQTEEEAKTKDNEILNMLNKFNINTEYIVSENKSIDLIYNKILELIK